MPADRLTADGITVIFDASDSVLDARSTNSATIYGNIIAGYGSFNPDDGYTPNAFVLCEESSAHGYDDWFVPSSDELNVLIMNNTSIGGFGQGALDSYWSSTTDGSPHYAITIRPMGPSSALDGKHNKNPIRCVRKQN